MSKPKTKTKSKSKPSTPTSSSSSSTKPTPTTTKPSSSSKKSDMLKSPFKHITTDLQITLPPSCMGDIGKGVEEYLSSFLMRYCPEISSIPLSYTPPQFHTPSGRILFDSPFFHLSIRTTFLVFQPRSGMILTGIINKISTDHIGLVTYGMFNVSIPQHKFGKSVTEAQVIRDAVTNGEIRVGRMMKFLVEEVIQANDVVSIVATLVGHGEKGLGVVETMEVKGGYLLEIEKFRNSLGDGEGGEVNTNSKDGEMTKGLKKKGGEQSPYLNEQPQRLMVDTAPSISTEVLPLVDRTSDEDDEEDEKEKAKKEKKEKKEKKSSSKRKRDEEEAAETEVKGATEQEKKKKKKKKD